MISLHAYRDLFVAWWCCNLKKLTDIEMLGCGGGGEILCTLKSILIMLSLGLQLCLPGGGSVTMSQCTMTFTSSYHGKGCLIMWSLIYRNSSLLWDLMLVVVSIHQYSLTHTHIHHYDKSVLIMQSLIRNSLWFCDLVVVVVVAASPQADWEPNI